MSAGDAGPRGARGRPALALAAVTLAGALLRVAYLHGRSISGDELGTWLLIGRDYGFLTDHFGGDRSPSIWLTMNFYVVVLKFIGSLTRDHPVVLALPGLLAGIALIPLGACLADRISRRTGSPRSGTALWAALFVALNPFLVDYSVRIRSYMLLTAFTLAALVLLLDWFEHGGWPRGISFALCSSLALLFHANAAYYLLFFALLVAAHVARGPGPLARRMGRTVPLALPTAVLLALCGLHYLPLLDDMLAFRAKWSAPAPSSLDYLPTMAALWLGAGALALPSLVLAALGLITGLRDGPGVRILALGVVLPIACASLAGVSHYPWALARFHVPMLPMLLVLVARGAAWLGERRPGQRTAPVPVLVAAVVLASWTPALTSMFRAKQADGTREVAAWLATELRPGDRVVAVGAALQRGLRPYVDEGIRIDRTIDPKPAGPAAGAPGRFFLVSRDLVLASRRPSRTAGNLQVVLFDEPSPAAAARAVLEELRASLGDRVAAPLADAYLFALQLMQRLGVRRGEARLRGLYARCLELTPKGQHRLDLAE